MPIKILVIDDQPDSIDTKNPFDQSLKERIQEALCTIENKQFNEPVYITDNRVENLSSVLKNNYDLIILDWNFPEEYPTGEETLTWLKENDNFTGPIIIHTKTGSLDFPNIIEPGHRVRFCWSGQGTITLAHLIKELSPAHHRIKTTDDSSSFKYYESFEAIKPHIYHLYSGREPLSSKEFEFAIDTAAMLTTKWDSSQTDPAKRLQVDTPMGKVIKDIEKLTVKPNPVFIQGDSGTGKELVAKLLHHHHLRKSFYAENFDNHCYQYNEGKHYYMPINCGAFSTKSLLNIELFGSLPGSFTDAINKAGIFEQVSYDSEKEEELGTPVEGGTVFLDEIALMEETSQISFLRVLQEEEVLREGKDLKKYRSQKKIKLPTVDKTLSLDYKLFGPIPVKFRLISATNDNLMKKIYEGDFRLDVYHRIKRGYIYLPNLHARGPEDFNLLFQFFIYKFNKKYKTKACLENKDGFVAGESRDLLITLSKNSKWEGNIRQLEGVVDVMLTYVEPNTDGSGHILTSRDIPSYLFN